MFAFGAFFFLIFHALVVNRVDRETSYRSRRRNARCTPTRVSWCYREMHGLPSDSEAACAPVGLKNTPTDRSEIVRFFARQRSRPFINHGNNIFMRR